MLCHLERVLMVVCFTSRSLSFLTFSIICYFEQNAVFQKWSVSIPELKVEEASDWYVALEVSTWQWKSPVSEMLLFYPIMKRLIFFFSHRLLNHWNEQSEVRPWVTVYYINVCFSLLSCLKLWHHEMKRYFQSHIRLNKKKSYFCVLYLSLTIL